MYDLPLNKLAPYRGVELQYLAISSCEEANAGKTCEGFGWLKVAHNINRQAPNSNTSKLLDTPP